MLRVALASSFAHRLRVMEPEYAYVDAEGPDDEAIRLGLHGLVRVAEASLNSDPPCNEDSSIPTPLSRGQIMCFWNPAGTQDSECSDGRRLGKEPPAQSSAPREEHYDTADHDHHKDQHDNPSRGVPCAASGRSRSN